MISIEYNLDYKIFLKWFGIVYLFFKVFWN